MDEKRILKTDFELRLHDFLVRVNAKRSADSVRNRVRLPEEIVVICEYVVNEIENCEYRFNRKVLEQMGIGSLFDKLQGYFISYAMKIYGKDDLAANLGRGMVRAFMKDQFGYNAKALNSTLRLYKLFSGNAEATALLTTTDMRLLAVRALPDECIRTVINLRRINPQIKTQQVKDLIATFKTLVSAPPLGQISVKAPSLNVPKGIQDFL